MKSPFLLRNLSQMGGHLKPPINPLGHQSPPYRRSNPLAPGTWESFRIASAAWCVQPTMPAKQAWCFSIFRTYISFTCFLTHVLRIHTCTSAEMWYICASTCMYIYIYACMLHTYSFTWFTYIHHKYKDYSIKLQKWITLCKFLGDFPIF